MYPDRHFDMVAKFAGTGSDTGRIQHLLREKRVRKDYFQLNTSDLDTITNYFLQKLIEKEQKE